MEFENGWEVIKVENGWEVTKHVTYAHKYYSKDDPQKMAPLLDEVFETAERAVSAFNIMEECHKGTNIFTPCTIFKREYYQVRRETPLNVTKSKSPTSNKIVKFEE